MPKIIYIFLFLLLWLPVQATTLVDINTASIEELEQLIGVGSVLAQAIIEARPFYSLDELTKVSRIGSKTIEKIKEQGLAWVDPELKPKEEAVEVNHQPDIEKDSRPLPVLLIALGLAGFSGGVILALKKRLEIV